MCISIFISSLSYLYALSNQHSSSFLDEAILDVRTFRSCFTLKGMKYLKAFFILDKLLITSSIFTYIDEDSYRVLPSITELKYTLLTYLTSFALFPFMQFSRRKKNNQTKSFLIFNAAYCKRAHALSHLFGMASFIDVKN